MVLPRGGVMLWQHHIMVVVSVVLIVVVSWCCGMVTISRWVERVHTVE